METAIIPDRWDEVAASKLAGVDLLIYLSRLVGSDPRLVLWGGGNTSLKGEETDFRGDRVAVMRVKGSGSDLKSVVAKDFPGVRLDDIAPLMQRDDLSDEGMVEYLSHTLMEPQSTRPSIETLLHGFVPASCVIHSHADAILAVTNNSRRDEILRELYGDELAIISYRRPGFLLSKQVGLAVQQNPNIKGVILINHGIITWHDDPREAYRLHVEMVDRAARYTGVGQAAADDTLNQQSAIGSLQVFAPTLRGMLTKANNGRRVIMHFDDSADVRGFVSGRDITAERRAAVLHAGAATPDHILNTKRRPLWLATSDEATAAYKAYADDYLAYYDAQRADEPLLAPLPRIVLVEGVGMFSVGKDSRAAQVAADIYHHTIDVVKGAERVGQYRSLDDAEAFRAEYWPLELYKLTLALPDKELAGRVALITGAAGAIGAGIAKRFAAAGAHVVIADVDLAKAEALAAELNQANPANRSIALTMDVTSEASVEQAYAQMAREYGGLDVLVSNAGIAKSAAIDQLSLADWQRSFDINATGHFLVARTALKIMKQQGIGGSMVFIATKNVPAPGKEFGAYSAAKAAEAQLARVLAIEAAPFGIRVNIVNPDAVFAGSGLWTAEVRAERARSYGIEPEELETFYQKRNLLGVEVSAADCAEAALFYAGERSAKTTGSMMPVDGGLREAFPR